MRAKRFALVFTIYLGVTVIGSFSFFTAGDFRFAGSGDNLKKTGGFLTTISHTIDCLAEDTVTIGKANKAPPSPLQSWWLRTFMPACGKNSGIYHSGSSLQIVNEDHIPASKNTIQIKLRI